MLYFEKDVPGLYTMYYCELTYFSRVTNMEFLSWSEPRLSLAVNRISGTDLEHGPYYCNWTLLIVVLG